MLFVAAIRQNHRLILPFMFLEVAGFDAFCIFKIFNYLISLELNFIALEFEKYPKQTDLYMEAHKSKNFLIKR